jgi:hypothetical protein
MQRLQSQQKKGPKHASSCLEKTQFEGSMEVFLNATKEAAIYDLCYKRLMQTPLNMLSKCRDRGNSKKRDTGFRKKTLNINPEPAVLESIKLNLLKNLVDVDFDELM